MKTVSEKYHEKYKIMDLPYTAYEPTESLKRRVIPYKKLVVPLRMRSVYWKYFGFPASDDGSIITKDKIVCILCKNQMIYNRNTSNLRMHLTSRHKNVMAKIDPSALIPTPKSLKPKKPKNAVHEASSSYEFGSMGIPRKSETKEVQMVVSEEGNEQDISNIAIIFPNDVVGEYSQNKEVAEPTESSEITDTVVNFIISDLIAPDVVDGKGFHCLMSNLSHKAVVIPNEKKLVNDIIPTMFNACKEQLYSSMQISSITNLSFSMEEWTCADSTKCISIYVHFSQNSEPSLNTRLLSTVSYTGNETSSYWSGILDRLLQEWLIDVNYVTAVIVSFNNDGLLRAIKAKNLITVPCFVFVIQQLCNEFCFHHYQVEPVIEKCRKLVKYLQDNRIEFRVENAGDASMDDDDDEENVDSPSLDRHNLWLTTYFMLKSLTRKKNAIDEAILNLDPELIHIVPTENEWKDIMDIVTLLEPLKTIVITLFEEKNSLISLLKPLVWKVNSSKFELNDKDSKLVQELKQQIRLTLKDAYEEQEVNNLTQIATILDPRFKNFVQQEGKTDIEATLTELLTNFVNSEGSTSPRNSFSEAERTPKKTSRISGINSLLGNICVHKPTMTLEDRIKGEVSHYQTECSALLEECPLDWWRHMSNKCPNLSRLAYRYHCVPAIITRTGNHSLLDYIKFHQKRSVLNVNIADALLFLHSNKSEL
ncbi:hypothetical protein V9T40_012619 [Parthenolecanium corni]|uniref:BED-type domain-containing protein n=1 Tax=Parthenolecanium corni TaxID=536013 RepID=A0AAN9Y0Q8_9HEMI